jgi:hypothetical protein
MSKKEKTTKAKSSGSKTSGKNKFLFLLCSVGAIAILKQSVVMLLIGMLPAIVAMIVDNTHGKSWAKTVFCFNLAGLLPSLLEVYIGEGNSMNALQTHMSDMGVWLIAYGCAGLAWLVIGICPLISEKFLGYYAQNRIASYQRKMEKLDAEWSIGKQSSQ